MHENLTGRSFFKNIITLFSGTALSQLILFLITPVLTRVYAPFDFGVYGFFTAVVGSVAVFVTLEYNLAILLPRADKDASALFVLTVLLAAGLSLLLFLGLYLFRSQLVPRYFFNDFRLVYLIPAGVFLQALFQCFLSLATRSRKFPQVAGIRITQSGVIAGVQLYLSRFKHLFSGLIVGNLVGLATASLLFLIGTTRTGDAAWRHVTREAIRRNAKAYIDFPRYKSFSSFLNMLSINLFPILLAFLYSPVIAGYYALTQRVMAVPVSLVGDSVRLAFYQEASSLHARGQSIQPLYLKTTGWLFKVAVIPFVAFLFLAPWLFALVFGDAWSVSGEYARLVMLVSFVSFIFPPAEAVINIINLQALNFRFQLVKNLVCYSLFLAVYAFTRDPYLGVFSYATSLFLHQLMLFLIVRKKLAAVVPPAKQ